MRDNSLEYSLTTDAGVRAITRSAAAVARLKDIAFNADVRSSKYTRSGQHGVVFRPSFKNGGVLVVTEKVRGSGAAVEAARTAIIAAANAMLDADGTLTWTNQGSATPLRLAGLRTLTDVAFKITQDAWDVQTIMESPKPFAEDAIATTVDSVALTAGGGGMVIPLTLPMTFTASGGGSLTVTHAGDFKYAYPILRVYGPITNPQVINQTTGKRLVFNGSIAAGEYWEIDTFTRAVTLNATTTRVRALVAGSSTWWACSRGANVLQLAGTGYSSSALLRAFMRSAWG